MATKQKINFTLLKSVARNMTENQLVFAINDCLETIQLQENCEMDASKYYGQLSVYRPALTKLRKGKRSKNKIQTCKICAAKITTDAAETRYCYSCGNKI